MIERRDFTPDVFKSALSGVDHVIYGIGLPEQFQFDDGVFDKVNCQLLRTFLEALRASGVRRLTYISTYEVFEVVGNEIDETHPIADESTMTPYFQSMVRAYRIAVEFARASGIELTTIHPAAVYGGRNTGGGITDYMENLASRNWHRLPFINPSSFPVVHVDSLTDAVIKSLNVPGAFIASDQMTSLKDIAQSMRKQVWSYVPLVLPLWIVMFGVELMEAMARIVGIKPFASKVQLAFLTKGWKPDASKAIRELGWKPLPLEDGISQFLAARRPSHTGEEAHAMTGSARVELIAKLELFTAAGLFLYWILYFTAGVGPAAPAAGLFRVPEQLHVRGPHSRGAAREGGDVPARRRSDSPGHRPRALAGLCRRIAFPGRPGHQLQFPERDLSDLVVRHGPGDRGQHLVPGVRLPAGIRIRVRCLPALLTANGRLAPRDARGCWVVAGLPTGR